MGREIDEGAEEDGQFYEGEPATQSDRVVYEPPTSIENFWFAQLTDLGTFARKILRPLALSDGTFFPAGSTVLAYTHLVSNDPDINGPNISAFDGLRYYKMWRQASQGTRNAERAGVYQVVSTSLGSLMFGYGKHACPGRFFAANEIKVLLAKLVMSFDMRLENTTERYKNVTFGDRVSDSCAIYCVNYSQAIENNIDATKNILFKRISPLEV